MSIDTSFINSDAGVIKANTGFTDWLWVAFEADGSLVTPRRDATGGSVTFSQITGAITDVYETPFEATANGTERIAYGDTSDTFGELCRLDNMAGGWLIQLFVYRTSAQGEPNGQEFFFGYGQGTDANGFWNLKQTGLNSMTVTFKDVDGNGYAPGTVYNATDGSSVILIAVAFDLNLKQCHLFTGSSASDLISPQTTGASFSGVASAKLPSSSLAYGLSLNARFNGDALTTNDMFGSDRTKDGAGEAFAQHHMVIRAEDALTKTSADVGELLGGLYDSLPSLPAIMEGWGNS